MGKQQPKKAKSSEGFVSDDVESDGQSSYMKFETGINKFRALSKPIIGWVVWNEDEEGDRKPTRSQIDDEPDAPSDDPKDKPKKFMALVVFDYSDDSVKILEITQQSVIKAINAYAKNSDWGNPFSYDITVTKKGERKKTRYTVQASPKKAINKDVIKAANEKPCNLDALYEGENPWETEGAEVTEYHFK